MLIDEDAGLRRVLLAGRVIAVVGLSADPSRPSYIAAKHMLDCGYQVIPVNPTQTEILGQKCYARLADIPVRLDIVDCFRKSEDIPTIADEAIAVGAKTLWLQLGIHNEMAERRAIAAGLDVVVDRCVKIEHTRLLGGRHWDGASKGAPPLRA